MLRNTPLLCAKQCGFLKLNPFTSNAPFLYPLKTSENRKVFWCFQRVEKGCIGNEWVNFVMSTFQASKYMFKINNRNTRARYEICSKLTIKTSERGFWPCSGVLLLALNVFHTFLCAVSMVVFEQVNICRVWNSSRARFFSEILHKFLVP